MNGKTFRSVLKEVLILIGITTVTFVLLFVVSTDLFSIGRYCVDWDLEDFYFWEIFDRRSFIFSFPGLFTPYIFYSLYRLIKRLLKKIIVSQNIIRYLSMVSVITIAAMVSIGYHILHNRIDKQFVDREGHYYLSDRHTEVNQSNYKQFKWKGGYSGVGDPFFYGTLIFPNDSLAVWSGGGYNAMCWDFPIQFLFKVPYKGFELIDTFKVVEDTVIIRKWIDDGKSLILFNVFNVVNNSLVVDVNGGKYLFSDTFKCYKEIYDLMPHKQ